MEELAFLKKELGYEPTSDQAKAMSRLYQFLHPDSKTEVFVLRGYAGTGKTSMVRAVVRWLSNIRRSYMLMAPTGRAAKVLSAYTKKPAFTIHRSIYRRSDDSFGNSRFVLQENRKKNALLIVDEASMISDEGEFGGASVLRDLVDYCIDGVNCKLLFIGDLAQLPPVGSVLSTALNPKKLKSELGLKCDFIDMREVVRQALDSGILVNATRIRQQLADKVYTPRFIQTPDVFRVDPYDLTELLHDGYADEGNSEVIVLTRSNKRANQFNEQIRRQILWREEEVEAGDRLMVVKNNYHWAKVEDLGDFIANGDMVEVRKIIRTEEMYGLRFADVEMILLDRDEEKTFQAKVVLDTLHFNGPSLPESVMRELREQVVQDHLELNKSDRREKLKEDPYLNALQVKFAYALTTHKAQGGQWKQVFIDQGYLVDDMLNQEYLRWLYTAFTRATEKVYLVQFREDFFEG
jgi:exodeoxyribonuclease-5